MISCRAIRAQIRGFTLLEVLVTLLLLAALALLSYRGLDAVLTARAHVETETDKWLQLDAFMARFKQDVQLAAPYPMHGPVDRLPAWQGRTAFMADAGVKSGPVTAGTDSTLDPPLLEFSRFASVEGQDRIRRVAYTLNAAGEIELWLWPGLDSTEEPARYPLLSEVADAEFSYLNIDLVWVPTWPLTALDASLPRAVRVQLALQSGEKLERIIALGY